MNRLLRLYPAAWRHRYGDEFSALLEDVPLSPFDVIDILLAAVDAHLRPQPSVAAAYPRRDTFMNRKHFGYAAIVGGGVLLIAFGIGTVLPMPIREIGFLLYPVAAVLLLLALTGLSAEPARHRTRRAWLAFLVPAAGLVVSLAGIALMALLPDRPVVSPLSPYHIFAAGLLSSLAGSSVFALEVARAGAMGRAPAAMLCIGAVAAFSGLAPQVVAWSPNPVLAVMVAYVTGTLLYCLGWISLGFTAVTRSPLIEPRTRGIA